MRVAVEAAAKVNLHLQVLGRRPDGFHELRTLLQSIDLADRLEAAPAPPGVWRLTVEPAGAVPVDDGNLVLRAARALDLSAGGGHGAELHLVKRIPVGGGLGGGSADAAAALVALDRVWGLELGPAALAEVAASLGSDVPFFLTGGLALGVGRGDEVCPLPDLPPLAVVVAAPAVEVATAEVYRRLPPRLTWVRGEASVVSFVAGLVRAPRWERMTNDLEGVVVDGWPEVAEVVARLRATGALRAAVTGSGAAAFALFEDADAAGRAAATLDRGWRVHVGSTLTRSAAALRAVEVAVGGDRRGR